jgi:Flp pilus assembly protein TadG
MIEFLFVTLTLCLLMFAGIEFDRMALVYVNLSDAAKAGVRYAIVRGADRTSGSAGPGNTTPIDTIVKNYATGVNVSNVVVAVTYPDGNNNAGSRVHVEVSYIYDAMINPMAAILPSGLTLGAKAEGVITW